MAAHTSFRSLLAQIDAGVLDDEVPLSSLLQKCLVLGGDAGSKKMRNWARQELNGYHGPTEEVPTYRHVPAALMAVITNQAGYNGITRRIPDSAFPSQVRDIIRETVDLEDAILPESIGELEAMASHVVAELGQPPAQRARSAIAWRGGRLRPRRRGLRAGLAGQGEHLSAGGGELSGEGHVPIDLRPGGGVQIEGLPAAAILLPQPHVITLDAGHLLDAVHGGVVQQPGLATGPPQQLQLLAVGGQLPGEHPCHHRYRGDRLPVRFAPRIVVSLHQGYGQDKPERCSKPAWPSSRASTFGTAEGPIAGGAVCSLKPLTRSFGPKAPGSLKSERGLASENESSLKRVSRPWAVRRLDHLHPC